MFWDQNKTPLYDVVKKHVAKRAIPLQIPGHKHGNALEEFKDFVGENVLRMDLNETRGIDIIWNLPGVIAEAEQLLAQAFGAGWAFFLINGTTSGVQAMIMSACKPGDQILLPRNSHKSIFNGLILSGARPVYLQPEINANLGIVMGATIDCLKKAIKENPQAKAVLAINPSYYGIAPNIKSIVETAHQSNMAVLVDEAHGTHLYFHEDLPLPAMKTGADASAVSLHKTGGSMTQSSALLISGSRLDPNYIKQVLNLTYTSSPSYILLCSLDVARKQLATKGRLLLDRALDMARWAREEINKIEGLYAPGKELVGAQGDFDFDETKLLVNVQKLGLTGFEVETLLATDYNILIELADMYNILAVISLGDRQEYLEALVRALKDIARHSRRRELKKTITEPISPEVIVPPREAFFSPKKSLRLEQCAGEIAGEMIMAYPPGIPLVCLGEKITSEIIEYIELLKQEKCVLQGTADPYVDYVMVLE